MDIVTGDDVNDDNDSTTGDNIGDDDNDNDGGNNATDQDRGPDCLRSSSSGSGGLVFILATGGINCS